MYQIIKENNNPSILIVTPLRTNDVIPKKLISSMNRNITPFSWVSHSGLTCAKNASKAIELYPHSLPDYIIKLDNDIEPDNCWLDKLYNKLKNTKDEIAYSYSSFSYYGYINANFPAITFDENRLKQSNYISSVSLFKTKPLMEVGGFYHDENLKRIDDWALLLKLLYKGYKGIPVDTYFKNEGKPSSISSGSQQEYAIEYNYLKQQGLI